MAFSCFIASALSVLIVSETAITPSSFSFLEKNSGVFPSLERSKAFFRIFSGMFALFSISSSLPPERTSPSLTAQTPKPESARKFSVSKASVFLSSAYRMIAPASGCSLFFSSENASDSSSSSLASFGMISVTFGSPFVIVPVLSRATISVLPKVSRASADLKRIEFLAPTPFPTMIATGVASPNAHGQLMTKTDMPLASEKPTLCPAISHTAMVRAAIIMTTGTKMPDTLSAVLAIGAFEAAVSLTILMI